MNFDGFELKIINCKSWDTLPPFTPLLENEIHLWNFDSIPKQKSLDACDPLFQHYLGPEYLIVRNPNGKPLAVDKKHQLLKQQFSISHSKSTFMIAFISKHLIGIDIEDGKDERPWRALAKRFYSPKELVYIDATDELSQRDLFLKLWTLKEAMIKCLGISIFTGIQKAHFKLEQNTIALIHQSSDLPLLKFFHQKLSHNFSIAITSSDSFDVLNSKS